MTIPLLTYTFHDGEIILGKVVIKTLLMNEKTENLDCSGCLPLVAKYLCIGTALTIQAATRFTGHSRYWSRAWSTSLQKSLYHLEQGAAWKCRQVLMLNIWIIRTTSEYQCAGRKISALRFFGAAESSCFSTSLILP